MNRLLIAAAVLLAPVVVASADEPAAHGPLRVGVAATEITPPLGYPMAGYFHERGATGTLDPLQAKAIVFRQDGTAAAIVVADLIGVDRRLADAVRKRIASETDIPSDNVVVAATHTHTGPDYKGELVRFVAGEEAKYVPYLIDRLAEAVIAADKAAQPATLQVGAGREETVSFNRRFVLKDGTVRTWARLSDADVLRAAGPIDPEVGLLTVTPTGADAPSAALVNFALHCDTVGGTQFSGDYPASLERVLRTRLGSGFASVFATGTCGDINHADPTGAPRRTAPEIGERLAAAVAKAMPNTKPVTPELAVRRGVIDLPLQSYTDADLARAEDVIARTRKGEKFPTVVSAEAFKVRRLHRLRTGREDLGRGTDETRPAAAGPRESLPAEVQAIRLGENVAVVALPGEVFVDLGLAIKRDSPFAHTFVIELANDSPAYVPTRAAMAQGGYEAANSLYAAGGGERLVETAAKLLQELKPGGDDAR